MFDSELKSEGDRIMDNKENNEKRRVLLPRRFCFVYLEGCFLAYSKCLKDAINKILNGIRKVKAFKPALNYRSNVLEKFYHDCFSFRKLCEAKHFNMR